MLETKQLSSQVREVREVRGEETVGEVSRPSTSYPSTNHPIRHDDLAQ